jgi:hypothetical protein
MSVWNQQKTTLLYWNDNRCPRQAFTEDLGQEVTKWLNKGDQLVIGMDVNEDVRGSPFVRAMKTLGLQELLTSTHGFNGPEPCQVGSTPSIYGAVTPTTNSSTGPYG